MEGRRDGGMEGRGEVAREEVSRCQGVKVSRCRGVEVSRGRGVEGSRRTTFNMVAADRPKGSKGCRHGRARLARGMHTNRPRAPAGRRNALAIETDSNRNAARCSRSSPRADDTTALAPKDSALVTPSGAARYVVSCSHAPASQRSSRRHSARVPSALNLALRTRPADRDLPSHPSSRDDRSLALRASPPRRVPRGECFCFANL